MTKEHLIGRAKALEISFFSQKNDEYLLKVQEEAKAQQEREQFAAVSGIKNQAVLDKLQEFGLSSETVVALTLYPLLSVAWADGTVQYDERDAILKAADEVGIKRRTPSFELMRNWLDDKLDERMGDAWKQYVKALCEELGPEEKASLKSDLLGRARGVAEAAGGFLGLGSKVSSSEQAVLADLEKAFE